MKHNDTERREEVEELAAEVAEEAAEESNSAETESAETDSDSKEAPESPQTDEQERSGQEGAGDETGSPEAESDADTFDREYVTELRKQSAGYRTRVRELEEQLHRLMVEQTGQLADPADLAFDPAHLEDPDALTAAIEALLADKPHLKARRFSGDIGQGARGRQSSEVSLMGILQDRL